MTFPLLNFAYTKKCPYCDEKLFAHAGSIQAARQEAERKLNEHIRQVHPGLAEQEQENERP